MKYKNLMAVLLIIIVILLISNLCKVKHQFWSIQLYLNIYNLKNWVFPEGIIEKSTTQINFVILSTYTVTMEQQDNEK